MQVRHAVQRVRGVLERVRRHDNGTRHLQGDVMSCLSASQRMCVRGHSSDSSAKASGTDVAATWLGPDARVPGQDPGCWDSLLDAVGVSWARSAVRPSSGAALHVQCCSAGLPGSLCVLRDGWKDVLRLLGQITCRGCGHRCGPTVGPWPIGVAGRCNPGSQTFRMHQVGSVSVLHPQVDLTNITCVKFAAAFAVANDRGSPDCSAAAATRTATPTGQTPTVGFTVVPTSQPRAFSFRYIHRVMSSRSGRLGALVRTQACSAARGPAPIDSPAALESCRPHEPSSDALCDCLLLS